MKAVVVTIVVVVVAFVVMSRVLDSKKEKCKLSLEPR